MEDRRLRRALRQELADPEDPDDDPRCTSRSRKRRGCSTRLWSASRLRVARCGKGNTTGRRRWPPSAPRGGDAHRRQASRLHVPRSPFPAPGSALAHHLTAEHPAVFQPSSAEPKETPRGRQPSAAVSRGGAALVAATTDRAGRTTFRERAAVAVLLEEAAEVGPEAPRAAELERDREPGRR